MRSAKMLCTHSVGNIFPRASAPVVAHLSQCLAAGDDPAAPDVMVARLLKLGKRPSKQLVARESYVAAYLNFLKAIAR